MNIALVCDYSLDYLGGAQTAFGEQVRALTNAGHHVVVIAPRGRRTTIGGAAHEWIDAPFSIPLIDLPYLRNTAELRDRVSHILARHRIEVVHVHSEFGLTSASIAAARDLRVRAVHTVHTFFWQAGPLPTAVGVVAAAGIRAMHNWMTGRSRRGGERPPLPGRPADVALRHMTLATAALADVVISPSEHQRAKLRAAGLSRVVTIPNTVGAAGADMPTRPTALARPAPLACIDGPLRIVWIGRCAPEKRLPEFVAACTRALDTLERGILEIEIIGDGPQLAMARRLAAGHPQITFTGRIPSTDIAAHLERAHVVALTSFGFDNQPMTVVESLHAARPVLYVDPALREGLAESSGVAAAAAGLLCGDETVAGMSAMLVALARDPARVIRASAAAHRAFDVFAPETFVAATEAVYRSLVPGYRPAPAATLIPAPAPAPVPASALSLTPSGH